MAQTPIEQSAAATVRIGPFVDSTDGVTAETGLSIGQADIQISKDGGAFAQTSASSPTTTHDTDGWYQLPLTATDTGTVGPLDVQITVSGALPVWRHFIVLPTNVYDAWQGTDNLQVDTTQVEGADATDQINAQADQAFTDYDPPTKAELDARTLLSASYFDPAADTVATVTDVTNDVSIDMSQSIPGAPSADTVGQALDNADTQLDAAVSSRSSHGDPDPSGFIDAAISSRSSHSDSDVWSVATREITALDEDSTTIDLDGSNVGGIAGTISTLDALDTAQDTQHASTQSDIAALNDLSTADIDARLAAIHLDHLLAVDYDPASPPGTATALLNELIESDGGVSRYTANSLEQAPSGGGGGDATEANQTTILDRLAGVMDADHTLSSGVGDYDPSTDSLEAIRDRGDAAWVGGLGSGDTAHTYTLTSSTTGDPIVNALVEVYTDEAMTVKVAEGLTNDFGKVTFSLDSGEYHLRRSHSNFSFSNPDTITVP